MDTIELELNRIAPPLQNREPKSSSDSYQTFRNRLPQVSQTSCILDNETFFLLESAIVSFFFFSFFNSILFLFKITKIKLIK